MEAILTGQDVTGIILKLITRPGARDSLAKEIVEAYRAQRRTRNPPVF
jgi:hypothetical protein